MIKKRIKIAIFILLVLLLLPVAAFFSLYIPSVQQKATQKITHLLSEEFGTPVEVGTFHYQPLKRVQVTHLLIHDTKGDTLIYAGEAVAQVNLKLSSIIGKSYVIDRLTVQDALVRFIHPPGEESNASFFFNSLQKDSTKKFWPYLGFREINLENSRLVLINGRKNSQGKVNFKDLELHDLNTEIRNLEIFKQQTRMRIRNLSFIDHSGWTVNQLDLNFEIDPEQLKFDRIKLFMPNSNIHADHLYFSFEDMQDFKDFENKVSMDIALRQSALGFHDLAWFLSDPSTIHNNIFISGNLKGTVSNIQVNHLKIQSGFESEFLGDIEAIGLPDLQNTYLFIDVNRLSSSVSDLKTFYWPTTHQQLSLPENVDAFGNVSYSGNFTGFISDFVSYGRLKTDIGTFSGDLSFKTDSLEQLVFQGQLNTYLLNLGKLLKNPSLAGQMTMNMHVNGHTFPGKRFRANLKGIIDSVEVNRYMFHKVDIDGLFTEKAYDGSINVEDDNLRLDFAGLVDFTQKIPEFDFSLNIPRANLFPLHIVTTDSSAFFSTLVLANFKGSSIDSLDGQVNVLDATLRRTDREVQLYDVALKASADSLGKSLHFGSSFAEGTLTGNYDLKNVKTSVQQLLSRYMPAIFPSPVAEISQDNNFTFQLSLTDPKPFQFFLPKLDFANEVKITGQYNPKINLADVTFNASSITWDGMIANNLLVEATAGETSLDLSLMSKSLLVNHTLLDLEKFRTALTCADDSINTHLSWDAPGEESKHSVLHFITGFHSEDSASFPVLTAVNDASRIWINKSWWSLSQAEIRKDSTKLNIRNFSLANGDRLFSIHGILSDHPKDTLSAQFRKLNLATLTQENKKGQFSIEGIIGGTLQMTGGWENPLFFSSIDIDNLLLNEENLGNLQLRSRWDTLQRAILFNINSQLRNNNPVMTEGSYFPGNKSLVCDLTVDSLGLRMFAPFVDGIFNGLSGHFSAKLHASGAITQPLISGTISTQETNFTMGYINTRYHFTASVPVHENSIDLSGITLYDRNGHSATSRGYLSLKNIKHPYIDLQLDARNVTALNIQKQDNDIFYGSATGTGIVSIKGPFDDISLDISATTGENSHLYLPLGQEQSISSVDFIEFVSADTTREREARTLTFPEKKNGLTMNLDLKFTPNAEVSLIFDPATGETLHSKGHGDLQLAITKTSGFSMFGEYTVDEGDYLFTLQNIISKKFRLENGGKITFNGDPLNADLDVKAIYPVKTSLYQLLYDENYQRRIPVECQILLSGKLQQPNIGFKIYLPTADEDTRTKVNNAITSEEELSKQFLSLLIINSFYPDPSYGQPGLLNTAGTLGASTTEMLSNQLSNWLSQISNDVDIGFSYHPGDEVTSEQVEVALSTQLLNDRVSINGNVDFKGQQTNTSTSNVVGDFQIEVKLTENGKLRVKAFTRANDKFLYETAPYTNGIGIFYREEFDSWNKLMSTYWNKIVTGNKEE